jgi:hypothetical protein
MRRRVRLSLVLAIGLVAMLGLAPAMLAKQGEQGEQVRIDPTSDFTDGITIESDEKLNKQVHTFTFEDAAYIPERTTPPEESIVVRVLSGTLVFRVQSPGVLVDSVGKPIQLVKADPTIDLGIPPKSLLPPEDTDPSNDPQFSLAGDITDVANSCVGTLTDFSICQLNPSIFANGDRFVLLEAGFTVYLPPNSTCFFCNVATLKLLGEEPSGPTELMVWSTPDGLATWEKLPTTSIDPGTTRLQSQELHDVRGWMLNPGSPCH